MKRKRKIPVQFGWRGTFNPFKDLDPHACGSALERLYAKKGHVLTPEDVVSEATDPTNALHQAIFYCDDVQAAHEHRLERARLLMRVCVRVIVRGGQEHVVRVLQSVEEPFEKTIYKTTEDALSDPSYRSLILKKALNEAVAFRRKYAYLSELALLFATIDKVRKEVS